MIEMKEIVYLASAYLYLGIGRVFPFIHSRNDFIIAKESACHGGQSTTTPDNRLEQGIPAQVDIFGEGMRDHHLMHAQDRHNYEHFKKCRAYEIAQELKSAGKIRHVRISFSDTSDVLDMILTEHPEIEIVQIQFNYMDINNLSVQSKKAYYICRSMANRF